MRTWTATTTAAAHPVAVLATSVALSASGPVAMNVAYRLSPATFGGSEVRASASVRSGGGFTGRLIAQATGALLSAGALYAALGRIAEQAALALP